MELVAWESMKGHWQQMTSAGPPTEEQVLNLVWDSARPLTEEQALDLAWDSAGPGSEALTQHGSRLQDSRGGKALGGGKEWQRRAPDLRNVTARNVAF